MIGNIKKNPYGTENISITENGTTTYNVRNKKYASITTDVSLGPHIYGAEWAGTSSPAWTRTDESANFSDPNPYFSGMASTPSSPFDGLMPWAGMRRVTNSAAGELVEIPKFWYKWTRDGAKMKLQIADGQVDGFYVSPAHADRGDGVGERDYVYVGRYHCASDYKSKSNYAVLVNINRPTARTNIHNLGSAIWQKDFAMFWTIRMLYLVEFAHWDSQAKIGYGCGDNSSAGSTGYTDSMPYHTGTTKSSRTTYGLGTQYRYIEGLWDACYDYCDGITFSNGNSYIFKNPSQFSDSYTSTGAIAVGNFIDSANTMYDIKTFTNPSSVPGCEWALLPASYQSNSIGSSYVTDTFGRKNGYGTVLNVGGAFDQQSYYGMFFMYSYNTTTYANAYRGARLMVLPSSQLT